MQERSTNLMLKNEMAAEQIFPVKDRSSKVKEIFEIDPLNL